MNGLLASDALGTSDEAKWRHVWRPARILWKNWISPPPARRVAPRSAAPEKRPVGPHFSSRSQPYHRWSAKSNPEGIIPPATFRISLRTFVPVHVEYLERRHAPHRHLFVMPDYLALGSDADFFRCR